MTINVVVLMGHSLTWFVGTLSLLSVTRDGKEDAVFRRGANRPTPRAGVRGSERTSLRRGGNREPGGARAEHSR